MAKSHADRALQSDVALRRMTDPLLEVHAAGLLPGGALQRPEAMSEETHALLEAYDAFFTDDLDFMSEEKEGEEAADPRLVSRNFVPVLIMLHLDWKSHFRISGVCLPDLVHVSS